jgi:hypothetical protein
LHKAFHKLVGDPYMIHHLFEVVHLVEAVHLVQATLDDFLDAMVVLLLLLVVVVMMILVVGNIVVDTMVNSYE